jgi:hypothetical protein
MPKNAQGESLMGYASLRYRRKEAGWVFLVAMVTLTVLLVLGASLIERAQNALYRNTIDNRAVRAFHLADAGISRAVWALNQHNGWLTYAGEQKTLLAGGYYESTILPAPADREPDTSYVKVLSTGYLPGPNGTRAVPYQIVAIVAKDPRFFSYAVFGRDKVRVGNGTVTVKADSYDSRHGGYGGGNVLENADVGTNSTAAGAVEILPQGEVHGNITVGPGASPPSSAVNNKGTITGTISSAPSPVLLPSVRTIPPGAIHLGDVWLDNTQNLVLNEGTYYMTDLDMFGSSSITCYGKVVIYLDESTDKSTPEIRIGGNGIVNTSGIPSNLVIYCKDDVVDISISGNGTFYGGIYAPKATITLNSGELYGSIIGRVVNMNGATSHVHYDEALHDPANPHAMRCAWHEL